MVSTGVPPGGRGVPPSSGTGPAVGSVQKSFAAAARGGTSGFFKPILLAPRQFGSKEGCPSVHFSTAELQEGSNRLQHSLVAKFSNGRPHIDIVRKTFIKTWNFQGEVSIGAWDAKHVLIFLKSEQDACRVLASPGRKVQNSWFRLFRWSHDFHTRKEPTLISAWVKLLALPPHMYDTGVIKTIVSSFGKFIGVDERTIQLSNPSFTRVCVEVDVSNPIPDKVWISSGNADGFWLQMEFQSKLKYCSKCHQHGHHIASCRKVKSGSGSDEVTQTKADTQQIQNLPPLELDAPVAMVQAEKQAEDQEGWQVQKSKRNSKRRAAKDKLNIRHETASGDTVGVEKVCPSNVQTLQVSVVEPQQAVQIEPTKVQYVKKSLPDVQVLIVEPLISSQTKTCNQVEPTLSPSSKVAPSSSNQVELTLSLSPKVVPSSKQGEPTLSSSIVGASHVIPNPKSKKKGRKATSSTQKDTEVQASQQKSASQLNSEAVPFILTNFKSDFLVKEPKEGSSWKGKGLATLWSQMAMLPSKSNLVSKGYDSEGAPIRSMNSWDRDFLDSDPDDDYCFSPGYEYRYSNLYED